MSEWRRVQFGKLGKTFSGLTGKRGDDFGRGAPYIPYMNIFSNGRINPEDLDRVHVEPGERQNRVAYGDLFFTTSSETMEEVGMTSVLLEDIGEAYLNSFCFGFRLFDFQTLLPEYAEYLFRSQEVRKAISILGQGSTRYNLPKTPLLARLELTIPERDTQRTIARILGTVDGLIDQTEALIAKQQQIKQGLLHDLFTRGLDASGQLRPQRHEAPELYEETALGWVPKGWKVKNLGAITFVRGRVGWKGYTVNDLRDDGPLVLGAAQISKDNRLKLDEPVFLSHEKYLESPEIMVEEGDLLIVQRGSIGKVVMVDEPLGPATINPSMVLLKVGNINATFLYHWLCTPQLQDQIMNATSSTGVPMISQAQVSAFIVPFPLPDEQEAIAKRMSTMMRRLRTEEDESAKLRLLKAGLMQDLLTGRVPVDAIMSQEGVEQEN